jgi:hypothetical protein
MSLAGEAHEYVPLHRLILIPADFSRLIWGTLFLFQIAWVWQNNTGWRISCYAILLAVLLAALGMAAWITALQIWIAVPWHSDLLQGFTAIGFVFIYAWASVYAAIWWRRDVTRRCPVCLECLRFPGQRGRSFEVLIDPPAVELICREGHGLLKESHWERTFQASRGFWQDLAGHC